MGRVRFVQPETAELKLSDGDYLIVKKRLSVGEERAAMAQIVGEVNANGWRKPNIEMTGIAEMAAYVVEWSFRDASGKRVPVSVGAIKQLDAESFKEVETAIEAHVKAMEEELARQKDVPTTATDSVQTLGSVA